MSNVIIQDSIPQQKIDPLEDIQPKKFIKIIQSGKIKKYIETALSVFQDDSCFTSENIIIVFSGKGPAINKTITIVEIIKRKLNGSLYQYTQIGRNFLTQGEEKEGEDDGDEDSSHYGMPVPVITIYLCSKMVPHLEETLGQNNELFEFDFA